MSIEAWADTARSREYRQEAEHQSAIDTIVHLLLGHIDAKSAADTIASNYEPRLKQGLSPSPVATLWDIICHAARVLGNQKEIAACLVNLLNSISALEDVTDEHGSHIHPPGSTAGVYWRDLPELAMVFRESAIDIEPMDDIEEGGSWDAQAVPLLNATTFAAMYLVDGKQSIGMPFHAEVSLMQGIEVPCETPEQQRCTSMYVPPAATWILLAGKSIYQLCKTDYNRKDGAPGSTPDNVVWLWGKGRGFGLERWAFWKGRFNDISGTQNLSDEVRDIASRAASAMDKCEG